MKINLRLQDGQTIPYHDIGPQEHAPQLALVAGVNGKELNGMFVLSRLAGFLNEINQGERPGQRLTKRIVIVPAANTPQWREDGESYLTRSDISVKPAPGIEDSRTLAEVVLPITRQAYYRVEIHTPTPDVEEMPQLRLYTPNDDERATACLFGLPAVIERPGHAITPLTLAWQAWGGENFVVKSGQANVFQIVHAELLFRALVGFLKRTGMIEGIILSEEEDDLHYFNQDQHFTLFSEHVGFFVSPLGVGRWVQAGDHIGNIYDYLNGTIQTELRAPVSGLVSTLRRWPMLAKGDFIVQLLTLNKSKK